MYTQCTHCDTVFALTQQQLSFRQGLVRCGRCREVFNATWNLLDKVPPPGARAKRKTAEPTGVSPEGKTATPEKTPFELGNKELEDIARSMDERSGANQEPEAPVYAEPDEEIVMEASSLPWEDFETRTDEIQTLHGERLVPTNPDSSQGRADPPPDSAPSRPSAQVRAPGQGPPPAPDVSVPKRISATRRGRRRRVSGSDIAMVELPRPRRPVQTVAWFLGGILAILLIYWQVTRFYIDDLAQISWLRPYLIEFCGYAVCDVPNLKAPGLIDLVETQVAPHPDAPGALRVTASLVNTASFDQAFPVLEVTLTDKAGFVLGRRTYPAEIYLGRRVDSGAVLRPKVVEVVSLDLAEPDSSAVGYEIQIVDR